MRRILAKYRSGLLSIGLLCAAGRALHGGAAAIFSGRAAFAGDTYWAHAPATPGDFDIPANWTNGVPSTSSSYQTGYIENGGTVLLNIGLTFTMEGLTLGGGSTMDQSAGTLTSTTPGVVVMTGKYILEGTGVLNTGVRTGAPLGAGGVIVSEFDMNAGTVTSAIAGSGSGNVGLVHITGGIVQGSLSASSNNGAVGYIIQDGGTVNGLVELGSSGEAQGSAYYTLNGGTLNVSQLQLLAPTAIFTQTAGSATATSFSTSTVGSSFQLSGGTFTAGSFTLHSGTSNSFAGGSLTIQQTASVAGTLDFGNGAGQLVLGAGGYFNFSAATLLNASNASLSVGAGALVILPQGFDPQANMASVSNAGFLHTAGTTLVIPAGQQLTLNSTPTFPDPIDVYGTLAQQGSTGFYILNGLTVRAGAQVNMPNGTISAETTNCLIQGGTVTTANLNVANESLAPTPPVITQSAGSVSANNITVGDYNSYVGPLGGKYVLQNGQLTGTTVQIVGSGTLEQDGGVAQFTHLTANASTARYTFSGGTLIISSDFTLTSNAILDFGNGDGVLEIMNGASANFSNGIIVNSFWATILVGQGATITFPPLFNPSTQLASFQTNVSLPQYVPPPIYVTAGESLQVGTVQGHLDVAGTVTPLPGQTASIQMGVSVHDGGSVTLNGPISIVDNISGISSGTLTGTSLSVAGSGPNTFIQSGGAIAVSGALMLSSGAIYSMTGGSLTDGGVSIGAYDTPLSNGTFQQTGGLHQVAGQISLSDYYSTAINTYALGGTGELDAASLFIEHSGAFIQTGGTAVFNTQNPSTVAITIGFNGNALPASYQISDGTLSVTGGVSIGALAQFTQTGGSVTINGALSIIPGYPFNQTGSYSISAGSLRVAGTLLVGSGTSQMGQGDSANAFFNVSGGQVDIDWLQLTHAGIFQWTGGDVHFYSMQFAETTLPAVLDMGNQARTVTFDNAFIDLRDAGSIINASGIDLVFGPNTMVLLGSASFNPTIFHSFTNLGVTAFDNNTVVIPAGRTLTLGSNVASLATYSNIPVLSIQVSGQLLGYMELGKPEINVVADLTLPAGGVANLGLGATSGEVEDGIYRITTADGGQITLASGSALTGGNLTAARVSFNSTTQSAGNLVTSDFGNGASGGYTLSGSATIQADSTYVQAGTFSQSGGSTFTTDLLSDDSKFQFSGGTLKVNNALVGEWASGATFSQSGGSFLVNTQLILGQASGSVGTFTMTGGTLQTPLLILGNSGKGIFNANGGTLTVSGTGNAFIVANDNPLSSPSTSFSLAGATVSIPKGTAQIGYQGVATFSIQAGSFSAMDMYLGENGTANASLTGGSLTVSDSLYVGPSTGLHSPGETPDTLTISGGTFTVGNLYVGQTGPCLMFVTSGSPTLTVNQNLVLGPYGQLSVAFGSVIHINAGAIATLNGGTLSGYGTIAGAVLAGSGPHTIAPSAGKPATSKGTLTFASLATNSNTTLALNLVTPSSLLGSDMIDISAKDGLAINGGTIQITGTSTGAASLGYYKILQYSGAIQGAGPASLILPATQNDIAYTLDSTQNPGYIDLHRGFLGDANDDGVVNGIDLGILAGNFFNTNMNWTQGDFNGDGVVNGIDLGALAANFFGTVGAFDVASASAGPASGVPEPASLVLLGVGLVGVMGTRRRVRKS